MLFLANEAYQRRETTGRQLKARARGGAAVRGDGRADGFVGRLVGVAIVGIAACLASHAVGESGVEHGEEDGTRQVDPPG